MSKKNRKTVGVVDGSDFAKVYLKYGIERLVEEGYYSLEELSSLDNDGVYTRRLLDDAAFRARLEKAARRGK